MNQSARRVISTISTLVVAIPAVAATGASVDRPARVLDVSTVVMAFPEEAGGMERPPVEFNHAAHTSALEERGCEACHSITEDGLRPTLKATRDIADRNRLIDAYHETCVDCHKERDDQALASGPVTCGECHVRRPAGVLSHAEMRFDYSLHGRHALAYPEKCEACHHVYDQELDKLVYEKGAEDACAACHGEEQLGDNPSLRKASHIDCVGCHLERSGQQLEAGPVLCVGCHAAERLQEIERLDPVPRLLRGQADTMWIHTPGTVSRLVPFRHLGHEQASRSCSQCHHARIERCSSCHGLVNASDGGGVVLERAHHDPSSELSCVGCHVRQARVPDCAGCHAQLRSAASERSCAVCHNGPAVDEELEGLPTPVFEPVELADLPAVSEGYPETVVIDFLMDEYEASKLPHAKIVARLDAIARGSRLATRFHGELDVLCAGCHHNSPVGTRPPPCRSCHGTEHEATVDRPDLKTAYHRQCVGCHIEMAIDEQGCTDCHAVREIQS